MEKGKTKRKKDIKREFADLFLQIANCPHRGQCKSDFSKIDADVRPQGGFIGSNYAARRVLIIGQNPGGGKAARANLGTEDDHYYEQVEELLETKIADIFSNFMNYLESDFMPRWPLFRSFNIRQHWGINISDIALINAVHCRTTDDTTPNMRVAARCFREHTLRQINLLSPKLIICFGKKAYDFLGVLYQDPVVPIKYILHPSGQYTRQHPDMQKKLISNVRSFLIDGNDSPARQRAGQEAPKKWTNVEMGSALDGLLLKGSPKSKR